MCSQAPEPWGGGSGKSKNLCAYLTYDPYMSSLCSIKLILCQLNISENTVWCVEENATYTIDNDNLRTILFLGDEQHFITVTRRSNPPLHYSTSPHHCQEKSAPQAALDTINFIKKMKRWGWIDHILPTRKNDKCLLYQKVWCCAYYINWHAIVIFLVWAGLHIIFWFVLD